MSNKTMELTRNIRISDADINNDSNIVDVVFATDTPVKRQFFGNYDVVNEILSMEVDDIDFSRINNGAAVCDSHDTYSLNSVIGAVVKNSARINQEKQAVCQIQLSERENIRGIVSDIKRGIISNVSVGYRVNEYKELESDSTDNVKDVLVTSWQPYEVSFVAVPADPNSKSNRKRSDESMDDVKKENVDTNKQVEDKDQVEKRKLETAKAVEKERKRIAEINKRCKSGNISDEKRNFFIDSGKSLSELANDILDEYEKANKQDIKRAYVYSYGDSDTKQRHFDALSNAIAHRACPSIELKDGIEFRQHSMLDIARSLISRGRDVNSMSSLELARVALTTSDFRKILANSLNKTLQAAYEAEPQTFRPLVNQVSATDFKEMSVNRLGDAPDLLEILEDGEYKYGGIGEEAEAYKLKTFGRGITLSRQAIINDDLNAFSRIAMMQGRAASRLESDIVWGLVNTNDKMSDGNNAFSGAHNNLDATSKKLDMATLSKVRETVRKQKTVDGKRMNLTAVYLVVPPSLETDAEQLMSQNMLAQQVSNINVFAGKYQIICDARLDGITTEPYYLFCSPNAIDTIQICYLNGQEGVYLDTHEDFDTDGVKYKCRLDFAAKIIDWRGMYRVNSK